MQSPLLRRDKQQPRGATLAVSVTPSRLQQGTPACMWGKGERMKRKRERESPPLPAPLSFVSQGQSETHSAGGLRKHEDGGRLHSKARASGLAGSPTASERAGEGGG